VALGLLGLLFFVFGGGSVAIDRLFRRKKPDEDAEDDSAYTGGSTGSTMGTSSTGTGTTRTGSTAAGRF
jgi:putative oxidoreductase